MSYNGAFENSKDTTLREQVQMAIQAKAHSEAAVHLAAPPVAASQESRRAQLAYDVLRDPAHFAVLFTQLGVALNDTATLPVADAAVDTFVASAWDAMAGVV